MMFSFSSCSSCYPVKILLEEMTHALNDPKSSGVKSTKFVFNDPEWIQSFEENWRQYASGEDWKIIFNNSSANLSNSHYLFR